MVGVSLSLSLSLSPPPPSLSLLPPSFLLLCPSLITSPTFTIFLSFQKSLQDKLEAAYLSSQEKSKEHELRLDSANAKSSQLQEQLDLSRDQCHQLEGQLQKKELALTAAQGKIDLLTAEAQTTVGREYCSGVNVCTYMYHIL